MAFGTPKVPSAYPALDSAVFTRAGGPALDALITDTIEGAHNRLQAAGAQMFSLAVPSRAIAYGDTTSPSYSAPTALRWGGFMPPLRHRKKPGHRFADYRVIVQAPSGVDFQVQVATQASPFLERADTSQAQIVSATGTGSWQTVSVNGVPVDPGIWETAALYVRTEDVGAEVTSGGYGTPYTDTTVFQFARAQALVLTAASQNWAETFDSRPNDYGSRGYFIRLTDSTGAVLGYFQLRSVSSYATNLLLVDFVDFIPGAVMEALRTDGYNCDWKLFEPVRLSLAAFAGATTDRSAT